MKQLITILIAVAMLQSCIPSRVMNEFTRPSLREPSRKEIRHERKGQRKLNRLLARYPELKRIDTIMTPITIITPERIGRIESGRLEISNRLRGIENEELRIENYHIAPSVSSADWRMPDFSVDFDDEFLTAQFSLSNSVSALSYTIKPMAIDTTTTTPCPTVQPKEYVRLPLKWWQIGLMVSGGIFILQVALRALLKLPSPV